MLARRHFVFVLLFAGAMKANDTLFARRRIARSAGLWSPWGEWSCEEDCIAPQIQANRNRTCLRGNCDPSDGTESASCLADHGPRCPKKWADWEPWNTCTSPCGSGTRKRVRMCEGYGGPCQGQDHQEEGCPVTMTNCPRRDGGWATWSDWGDCNVRCGYGDRERKRTCSHPYTSGGGQVCPGVDSETEECHTGVLCPIDGAWTQWGFWSCDRTCEGNHALRIRHCINPAPAHGGLQCSGPIKEVKFNCNPQKCPDPIPIIPDLVNHAVQGQLNNQDFNIDVDEGNTTTLDCPKDSKETVMSVMKGSKLKWTKAVEKWKIDTKRIYEHGNGLMIRNADPSDSGIYLCQVEYWLGKAKTVGVFALNVNTNQTGLEIEEHDDLHLTCGGAPLGHLFKELRQQWYHNGSLYIDYGYVEPHETDALKVKAADVKESGEWACHILHVPTRRVWTTRKINVVVRPKPTLAEQAKSPTVLFTFAIIVCGALAMIGLYVIDLNKKHQEKVDKKNEGKKEKLLELLPMMASKDDESLTGGDKVKAQDEGSPGGAVGHGRSSQHLIAAAPKADKQSLLLSERQKTNTVPLQIGRIPLSNRSVNSSSRTRMM